jgi:DNA-binding SARP family transcriptional activator
MIEVRILGPLEVREGSRLLPVSGEKQRALLALLALHANEVVSSEHLLDQLWGEETPSSRATALQVRIHQLRKALGSAGARIVTQAPGYVLRLERDELDLHRFERLLAETEDDDPATTSAKLRQALKLWRGPPLTDFTYEGFAQAAIGRLVELRLAAIERRIDADLVLGRHAHLVGELEQLVAENPLREAFRRQLMLALYRSGRQAEALEAYQAARRSFLREFGLQPTPALQGLERAILQQDPDLDLIQPGTSVRSILVGQVDAHPAEALVTISEVLAREPPHELIVARLVSELELRDAFAQANDMRETLIAKGLQVRTAVFTSSDPGRDLVRLATEQDIDLLLTEASAPGLDEPAIATVLAEAPCDVAVLVARTEPRPGEAVLVPFAGAEHDWSAIELGAWIARNQKVTLRLAGPRSHEGDSSRLLASASLAVQRALGVAAEPLLVEGGSEGLVLAADDAALVVLGLPDRWRDDGLGESRAGVVARARPPVLLVRRGLRPGGLAPTTSYTRFTWSLQRA